MKPMERKLATFFLLGFAGLCVGSGSEGTGLAEDGRAPRITREYLLSQGFKKSPEDRREFVAERVRLGDAVRKLGVPLSWVVPFEAEKPNSTETREPRICALSGREGFAVYIYAEQKYVGNRTIAAAFTDPTFTCKVVVVLDFEAPSAEPRVRIKSLAITDRFKRDLRVVFELSAAGKTPLAFSQAQFGVHLIDGNPKRYLVGTAVTFPKETPKVVTVSGAKPILLTMDVRANFEALDERVNLASLAPGDYRLGVILFGDAKGTARIRLPISWPI